MLQTQRLAARGGLPKAPPGAMGALDVQICIAPLLLTLSHLTCSLGKCSNA